MTRLWHFKSTLLLFALFQAVWCSSQQTVSGQTAFDAFGDTVNKVYEDNKDCIVRVKALQDGGNFLTYGTGFYIDKKGTILTASAILGPSDQVKVEINGLSLPAQILCRDDRSGVVLLRVFNGVTPFLQMAEGTELKIASPVIGLGFPLNLPIAPTFGMITGFDCQYLDRFFVTTHLRTSMSISPGQIGGPVLNTRGELVGMIVMAADERKFTYALPLKAIQRVLAEAMHGGVKYGWVGVDVIEDHNATTEEISQVSPPVKPVVSRVKITKIIENTPAAASGLKSGDIVVKIGNRDITKPTDVIDASFFARVGEQIPVAVERDGKLLTFQFVVGERPGAMPSVMHLPKAYEALPMPDDSLRTPDAVNVSSPAP